MKQQRRTAAPIGADRLGPKQRQQQQQSAARTVYKISDLFGKKKKPITTTAPVGGSSTTALPALPLVETAFKISKSTSAPAKPKKPRNAEATIDILYLHTQTMKQFDERYANIIQTKLDQLGHLCSDNPYCREKNGAGGKDGTDNPASPGCLSKLGASLPDNCVVRKALERGLDRSEMVEYLLKTAKIISEYLAVMDRSALAMQRNVQSPPPFTLAPAIVPVTTSSSGSSGSGNSSGTSGGGGGGVLSRYITCVACPDKERLTEEYCRVVNHSFLTEGGVATSSQEGLLTDPVCQACGKSLVGTNRDKLGVCMDCGMINGSSTCTYIASYREMQDSTYKTAFSYKRTNRFNEILATLQAKENTDIPAEIIQDIQNEIAKEPHLDLQDLTKLKIKQYLKKLKYTKYYEHAPTILNRINGIMPMQIDAHIEAQFVDMFRKIQDPFDIVVKRVMPNRKSFFNYNYVLLKFCELLKLHKYKSCFTLLKSTEKLRLQDAMWKGVCEIVGWEFIPTI